MRWGIVITLLAALTAGEAAAGSILVYNGAGKIDHVVRPSPSGFVVYDHRGDIIAAVRAFGFDSRPVIVTGRSDIRVLGTTLPIDASGLRGGVGFE